MTALEQRLLDDLEQSERERERGQQELENLAESYKQNIKQVSNSLTAEYQQKLTELIQNEDKESENLIAFLETISQQNKKIIELLSKPPVGDSFKEALDDALEVFSNCLMSSLEQSNEQLIEGIETSLEKLYSE